MSSKTHNDDCFTRERVERFSGCTTREHYHSHPFDESAELVDPLRDAAEHVVFVHKRAHDAAIRFEGLAH